MDRLDCLIIGAGVSGLLAARQMAASGLRVKVLEKSRGVGGRMATRREGEECFDQGAQFFTVREPAFQLLVDEWLEAGVATLWFGGEGTDLHPRYRGSPGMTAIGKHLAAGLAVERAARVVAIARADEEWTARTDDGRTWTARSIVLSSPVPQSLQLLEAGGVMMDPDLRAGLGRVRYDPCLALMVTFEEGTCRLEPPGWIRPGTGPILWLADNSLKGVSGSGRPALTIHADPEFSRRHYQTDEAEVVRLLVTAARPWVEGPVVFSRLHRWKFSQVAEGHPDRVAVDRGRCLVFCGDGFGAPKIEGAALSGMAAGRSILGLIASSGG